MCRFSTDMLKVTRVPPEVNRKKESDWFKDSLFLTIVASWATDNSLGTKYFTLSIHGNDFSCKKTEYFAINPDNCYQITFLYLSTITGTLLGNFDWIHSTAWILSCKLFLSLNDWFGMFTDVEQSFTLEYCLDLPPPELENKFSMNPIFMFSAINCSTDYLNYIFWVYSRLYHFF